MVTAPQLLNARKRLKLTAARVAEKIGVSVNSIYTWESGAGTPRDEKVRKKLYDVLGIVVNEKGKKVPDSVRAENGKRRLGREVRAPRVAARKDLDPIMAHVDLHNRSTSLVALFRLVAFFMGDPARRSNTIELLELAKVHKVTVDELLSIIKSHDGQ